MSVGAEDTRVEGFGGVGGSDGGGGGACKARRLRSIDVSFNSALGNQGASVLARWIRQAPWLFRVGAEGMGCGNEGAAALATAVAASPGLHRLDLAHNPDIGKSGRKALAEATAGDGRSLIWCKETSNDNPWEADASAGRSSGDDSEGGGGREATRARQRNWRLVA